jgi:methylated-DNA-protein-cysteine methyltransferase-like protein
MTMKSEESFNAATDATIIEQVFTAARSIPPGRVLSYGALGARCDPPISGYICGRIMNNVANDVPWWRVVAKDGSLPIAKRNPHLAQEQRDRLQAEGVEFDAAGRVLMDKFTDL